MLDRGRLLIEADADDVEPHVVVEQSAGGDEVSRHACHLRLLARIDRLERRPRTVAASAAHLDEDQRRSVQGDQVDLAGPAAEVALHDGETLGTEQLGGERLASPADLSPPIHGAGEYSPVNALARRDAPAGVSGDHGIQVAAMGRTSAPGPGSPVTMSTVVAPDVPSQNVATSVTFPVFG